MKQVYVVMQGDTPLAVYADKSDAEYECVRQVAELYEERGFSPEELQLPDGMLGVYAWNEFWEGAVEVHVYIVPLCYIDPPTKPPKALWSQGSDAFAIAMSLIMTSIRMSEGRNLRIKHDKANNTSTVYLGDRVIHRQRWIRRTRLLPGQAPEHTEYYWQLHQEWCPTTNT